MRPVYPTITEKQFRVQLKKVNAHIKKLNVARTALGLPKTKKLGCIPLQVLLNRIAEKSDKVIEFE